MKATLYVYAYTHTQDVLPPKEISNFEVLWEHTVYFVSNHRFPNGLKYIFYGYPLHSVVAQ